MMKVELKQVARQRAGYISAAAVAVTSFLVSACAQPNATVRTVDDPAGKATVYGKPKNTTYYIDTDPQKETLGVTVYESSKCDVIPVTVMQRYKVVYRGEKEVSRSPLNKTQVAGDPTSEVTCNQTYARDVEVVLQADDGARYTLGTTNKNGRLEADLADVFQAGSYDALPEKAKVIIRPPHAKRIAQAGEVKLKQLSTHQARVAELLAKLDSILAKGETGASKDEITESYELYSQLVTIAGDDPRVLGAKARFWELFYGRKQAEALDRMKENLSALEGAKEALKAMGDAAIPLYVQAAVNSGYMDQRTLEWSSLRLIRAIKGTPQVCSSGFSYSQVEGYGWPADARVAAGYTQYAYGDEYAATVTSACRY